MGSLGLAISFLLYIDSYVMCFIWLATKFLHPPFFRPFGFGFPLSNVSGLRALFSGLPYLTLGTMGTIGRC